MADETSATPQQGGRPGGNREPGGFRIRLSDNEMRAARALQDAFRLRSTVAVLGFSLRTLAQMLEEGKLDELVAQQRAQGGDRDGRGAPRPRRSGGEDRGPGEGSRAPRIDPFARPSRPANPAAAEAEAPAESAVEVAAADASEAADTSAEATASEAVKTAESDTAAES
jgi:hypothetical protein